MNYPKQHEALLRKAGLLGTGKLEIRCVHRIREHQVSDDGMTFEKVKRPDATGILTTSTSLIKNQAGNIAGYWANGLTVEERNVINMECSVPYYYLDEPINPVTGTKTLKNTRISIREGQVFNMQVPSDVAEVLVLKEVVSTIAANRQEALNENTMFYFFSKEEEEEERAEKKLGMKNAAKLVDTLSDKEKQGIIRLMSLKSILSVDPYISKEGAVDIFDEIAFSMPKEVIAANNVVDKERYICILSLVFSGYIDASSSDGPYYKNEQVFGTRAFLADSLNELVKKIHTHSDLINAFDSLEKAVKGFDTETSNYMPTAADELLGKHGIGVSSSPFNSIERSEQVVTLFEETKRKMNFMKVDQVIAMLDSNSIEHQFNSDSPIKEVKEYFLTHYKT